MARGPRPASQCHQVQEGDGHDLWEIKSGQIRIFCFWSPGNRLILAFGVRKKPSRHRPKDIVRATSMRTEFLNEIQRQG